MNIIGQVAFLILLILGIILIPKFRSQPLPDKKSVWKNNVMPVGLFAVGLVILDLVYWAVVSNQPGPAKPPELTATSSPTITWTVLPSATSTLSPTFTLPPPEATFTSTPKPTATSVPCLCASSTDYETITCLIHQESEAANKGDLGIISRIFAPNAVIFRGDTNEIWNDPLSYYRSTFNAVKFIGAYHDDLAQVKRIGRIEYWVSVSGGEYIQDGVKYPIKSQPSSDHWIFEKNQQGCWVITRFEFNASLISFPPK
jgi:hypothetical protein